MLNIQPPFCNGELQLSDTKSTTLKNQLQAIIDDFVPTEQYPVCNTFYLVVAHTKKHGAQSTFTQLNGDTVEALLRPTEEVVEPQSEVL